MSSSSKNLGDKVVNNLAEVALPEDVSSNPGKKAMVAFLQVLSHHEAAGEFEAVDRTGVALYWGKLISGQVLDKKEAMSFFQEGARLVNNIQVSDPYLTESLTLIKTVFVQLAQYSGERTEELLGNKELTRILFSLYRVLLNLIKKLNINPGELNEHSLKDWKDQLQATSQAFAKYSEETSHSSNDRRGEISFRLKEATIKLCSPEGPLALFVAKKPLQDRMRVLETSTKSFSVNMQRMLLGLIVVKHGEAEKTPDLAWTNTRLLAIETILVEGTQQVVPKLAKEEKTLGASTNKKGVLATNPFSDRIKSLEAEREKFLKKEKEKSAVIWSKKAVYFDFMCRVFEAVGRNTSLQDIIKTSKARFLAADGELKTANNLIHQSSENPLTQTESEWTFIQASAELMQQGHELARFLHYLNDFMHMVGMVGLHQKVNLHKTLENIIEKAKARFSINCDKYMGMTKDRISASRWLTPIHKIVEEVKQQGQHIKNDLLQFRGEFEKIADKREMEIKFNAARDQLLSAAQGLGLASGMENSELSAFSHIIQNTSLNEFVSSPTPHLQTNIATESMEAVIGLRHELTAAEKEIASSQSSLAQKESEVTESRAEVIKLTSALETSSQQLQAKAEQAKVLFTGINATVEKFHARLKERFEKTQQTYQKDFTDITDKLAHLKAFKKDEAQDDADKKNTLILELSELKGKLEVYALDHAAQREDLNAFIADYNQQSKGMGVQLESIAELAGDVHRQIGQLSEKISSLTREIELLKTAMLEFKHQAAQALEQEKIRADEAQLRIKELEQRLQTQAINLAANKPAQATNLGLFKAVGQEAHKPIDARKVSQQILLYETEIKSSFAWNKDRKAIKWAVWKEVQKILESGAGTQDIIVKAISNLKHTSTDLQVGSIKVNDLIKEMNEVEIEKEFAAGRGISRSQALSSSIRFGI